MYKLIEYSDTNSDTSGSLWQFKRDEVPDNNADLTINNDFFNSQSFKYKADLVGKTSDYVNPASFAKRNKNSCSIEVFKQFLKCQ